MPFTFGEEPSNTGDSIGVQCMVTKGDSPIDITWLLNNRTLVHNENQVTILKVSPRLSSLSIESLSHKHRGIFKCIAANRAGLAEFSTELKVNGT